MPLLFGEFSCNHKFRRVCCTHSYLVLPLLEVGCAMYLDTCIEMYGPGTNWSTTLGSKECHVPFMSRRAQSLIVVTE